MREAPWLVSVCIVNYNCLPCYKYYYSLLCRRARRRLLPHLEHRLFDLFPDARYAEEDSRPRRDEGVLERALQIVDTTERGVVRGEIGSWGPWWRVAYSVVVYIHRYICIYVYIYIYSRPCGDKSALERALQGLGLGLGVRVKVRLGCTLNP